MLVGGIGVLVSGGGVLVGGIGVLVGGTGVGTAVYVGSIRMCGVTMGGTGVLVGGTGVSGTTAASDTGGMCVGPTVTGGGSSSHPATAIASNASNAPSMCSLTSRRRCVGIRPSLFPSTLFTA